MELVRDAPESFENELRRMMVWRGFVEDVRADEGESS